MEILKLKGFSWDRDVSAFNISWQTLAHIYFHSVWNITISGWLSSWCDWSRIRYSHGVDNDIPPQFCLRSMWTLCLLSYLHHVAEAFHRSTLIHYMDDMLIGQEMHNVATVLQTGRHMHSKEWEMNRMKTWRPVLQHLTDVLVLNVSVVKKMQYKLMVNSGWRFATCYWDSSPCHLSQENVPLWENNSCCVEGPWWRR